MKSIFNTDDNAGFISRINKLTAAAKSEWGKMTVDQMLRHCQGSIKVALGDVKHRRSFMSYLFAGMGRKKIMQEEPFGKFLPTDKHFVAKDHYNFEEEKSKLISLIQRLEKEGASSVNNRVHPFFSKLNSEQWGTLICKHLDHHLRQFGV